MQPKNILVTGGAGFIGSNLVETLLSDERIGKVRVLDNLSTGFYHNIAEFENNPKFEFTQGDIRDYNTCLETCEGVDLISHQAALGSVPRSINDPITTNAVNITGTLNIFAAAKEKRIKRVVFAASSSTYGDSVELPKVEDKIGKPLSPYAVTKYVSELYAHVFALNYDFEYIGLRYFNVFGPKQNPNGAYAAVIPLFIQKLLNNERPTINGDGLVSRDFTYVANAVQANLLALFTDNKEAINQIYNVACGERTTLKQMWEQLKIAAKSDLEPIYGPNRKGDIPHSLADISKIKQQLDYVEKVKVMEGLSKVFNWYEAELA
jgi:UDP-N-acetylglucosamine/UDP-N-acetylgalactosamine 4-epimerase